MDDSTLPPGARFHQRHASVWSAHRKRSRRARRRRFIYEFLQEEVRPGAKWLDLGCGSGDLTHDLAQLGAIGEAVDGSPAMIAAATSQSEHPTISRFRFNVCSIETMSYPEGAFCGVLCSSVIEYLDRPDHALDVIARVIRPGGRLILSVPNPKSPVRAAHSMLRRFATAFDRNVFEYLEFSRAHYTPRSLARALNDRGFRIKRIDSFDPTWVHPLLPGPLRALYICLAERLDANRHA